MQVQEHMHEPEPQAEIKVYQGGRARLLKLSDLAITVGNDAIGLTKDESVPGVHAYCLNSYPKIKKFLRKQRRYLEEIRFQVRDVIEWEDIRGQIISKIMNRHQDESRRLLVMFNPNAGANSANHLHAIEYFISKTNLIPQIFETQYRNHCLQHLRKIDPQLYCAVAIVSGDGLMHEYVNSFCGLPVTHVPAGSGNAFARTQMEIAGEQCADYESIFLVVKNRRKRFNLIKYELEKLPEPVYSFLSLEWAIIADIDMSSQVLRCCGGFRFDVYGTWRCLAMRRYPAKLTYSAILDQLPPLGTQIAQNPSIRVVDKTFLHTIFSTIPYISDKYKIAPLVNVDDRLIDCQFMPEESGRISLIKYLINMNGCHFDRQEKRPAEGINFEYHQIKSFRLQPRDPQRMGIFGIDGQAYEAQRIQASFDERTFQAFV